MWSNWEQANEAETIEKYSITILEIEIFIILDVYLPLHICSIMDA